MQKALKLIAIKQTLSYETKKPDESVQDYYNRLIELASVLLNSEKSIDESKEHFDLIDTIM